MDLDKLATLLASGVPAGQAASSLGVSAGRISQLWNAPDEKLKQLVISKKQASSTPSTPSNEGMREKLDTDYLRAETRLLKHLVEGASTAEYREITSALKVVAERNDRNNAKLLPSPANTSVQMVNLFLPPSLLERYQAPMEMNSSREVISVADRALAPMSSKNVLELFSSMEGELE